MLRFLTKFGMRLLLGVCLALGLSSVPAAAQGYNSTGLMLKGAWPTGELDETQDFGLGLSLVTRSRIGDQGRLWFHGQGSYLNFPGSELQLPSSTENYPDAEIWGISLGVMVGVSDRIFVGVEGGYFFGDEHSWGMTPFVSIIRNNLEIMLEYKALGISTWYGVSVGYYLF